MYQDDKRIVITLDAGGTNFVFGAMRGNRFIGETITYPSNSDDLDKCLQTMIGGFREVISSLPQLPVAISFAFPGPADYARGVIGGFLPNFPPGNFLPSLIPHAPCSGRPSHTLWRPHSHLRPSWFLAPS